MAREGGVPKIYLSQKDGLEKRVGGKGGRESLQEGGRLFNRSNELTTTLVSYVEQRAARKSMAGFKMEPRSACEDGREGEVRQ